MGKNKKIGEFNDYVKINKKINREIELEKNGWRWTAVNKVHKNKKKYNRKRDRRVNLDCPFEFYIGSNYLNVIVGYLVSS